MGWFLLVVLDQLAKASVVSNLADGSTTSRSGSAVVPVLGDVLKLDLVYNSGSAFRRLLPFLNPTVGYGLLFALAALLLIRYGLARQVARAWWAIVLVLGGASGNFIDRIRIGQVVDFVSVGIPRAGWHFPTFNLADLAICTGAGLLAWRELGEIRRFQGFPCKGLPARESTEFEPNDRI